ncbi:uncharacterized protein PSFLO_03523 [Pseudozyma flocculosa]|uniref:Uncharacterized protein n=1 Tax=Pseudozyma flocculosa TaxID=84751 RepID=A0A5C3F2E2_9BASI|nr:uncharacterized protein PSFLO_03523 [Pseudozyma flocculosa]
MGPKKSHVGTARIGRQSAKRVRQQGQARPSQAKSGVHTITTTTGGTAVASQAGERAGGLADAHAPAPTDVLTTLDSSSILVDMVSLQAPCHARTAGAGCGSASRAPGGKARRENYQHPRQPPCIPDPSFPSTFRRHTDTHTRPTAVVVVLPPNHKQSNTHAAAPSSPSSLAHSLPRRGGGQSRRPGLAQQNTGVQRHICLQYRAGRSRLTANSGSTRPDNNGRKDQTSPGLPSWSRATRSDPRTVATPWYVLLALPWPSPPIVPRRAQGKIIAVFAVFVVVVVARRSPTRLSSAPTSRTRGKLSRSVEAHASLPPFLPCLIDDAPLQKQMLPSVTLDDDRELNTLTPSLA